MKVFQDKSELKENNECVEAEQDELVWIDQSSYFKKYRLSQYYPKHQGMLNMLSKQEVYSLVSVLRPVIR